MHDLDSAQRFLGDNPDIEVLEAFVVDVNGVARGKWIPRSRGLDVLAAGMPLPRSAYALDIWGRDVAEAGLAVGTGDPDGLCLPVSGTLSRVTWLERPTAQVLLGMHGENGSGFHADPRQVLARVVERYRVATPVVATELEFYLVDPVRSAIDPVRPPRSRDVRWQSSQTQVLSLAELHDLEHFFSDVSSACKAQSIPADTVLRENGPGQYEINLV